MSTSSDNPTPTAVTEIVVNLDDVTGELIGEAQRKLMQAGALDVWTTPIQMKKQRPAVSLSLLCEPQKRDELARLVIELTGSFGVRYRQWDRLILDRRHVSVETRFGKMRIKIGELDGKVVVARPEFDDAKRLAQEAGVTVREVMDAAQAAAAELSSGGRGAGG